MPTQKIAITVPEDLIGLIDQVSQARGVSRSSFISSVLREKLADEKNRRLRDAYNRVFDDEDLRREQIASTAWEDYSVKR
jgi:metal-responsive CopG/Arc/MetJ family transcriptional regulator